MVTFKRGWGKLYYTQHTLLSNMRQLLLLLLLLLLSLLEKLLNTSKVS